MAASAPYALMPAFTLVAISSLRLVAAYGLGARLALTAVSALIALVIKGATAAFYLRRVAVGDDGAAFLPKPAWTPPSAGATGTGAGTPPRPDGVPPSRGDSVG